jgi:hypothetical protein
MDPLLQSGGDRWGIWSAGWSLREVEPETNLVVNLAAPEVADRPEWHFGVVPLAPKAAVEADPEDDAQPADELGLLTAQPVLAAEGEPKR